MDWGEDLPARSAYRVRELVEKAIDKAILLDTERNSVITDALVMLLTEIEQVLEGNDPYDYIDEPEQLELDLPDPEEDRV